MDGGLVMAAHQDDWDPLAVLRDRSRHVQTAPIGHVHVGYDRVGSLRGCELQGFPAGCGLEDEESVGLERRCERFAHRTVVVGQDDHSTHRVLSCMLPSLMPDSSATRGPAWEWQDGSPAGDSLSGRSTESATPERREKRAWVVAVLADALIAFGLVVLAARLTGGDLLPTLANGSPPISGACALGF